MTLDHVAEYTGQTRDSVYKWWSRFKVRRQTMARTEDVVAAKMTVRKVGRPRKTS